MTVPQISTTRPLRTALARTPRCRETNCSTFAGRRQPSRGEAFPCPREPLEALSELPARLDTRLSVSGGVWGRIPPRQLPAARVRVGRRGGRVAGVDDALHVETQRAQLGARQWHPGDGRRALRRDVARDARAPSTPRRRLVVASPPPEPQRTSPGASGGRVHGQAAFCFSASLLPTRTASSVVDVEEATVRSSATRSSATSSSGPRATS